MLKKSGHNASYHPAFVASFVGAQIQGMNLKLYG
jgi:hypothetical protein